MMTSRLWAVVAISTFTTTTLAGVILVNSSLVGAQNGDNQENEYESKIQRGFSIAPVH
jgi:hypothetical protein